MIKNLVGIEIGGTKIQVVIGNEAGSIRNRYRFSVRKELGAKGILAQIEFVLKEWKRHHLLVDGVGVGFGGPVDYKNGRVICSYQIKGWENFDMRSWITQVYGPTRVCVENDANTAGLGEARHGAGVGYDPIVYVTLGSGVGGGAVVENQIYHGAAPGEMEVGHLCLDKTGRTVESSCSGWAVDQKILHSIQDNPHSKLAELCAEIEVKQSVALLPALQTGDGEAKRILAETADDLALALSHTVHLIHPQAIILGGGLSLIGEPLRAAVAEKIPSFLMDAFQPGPKILLAQLGEDVVPVGALELVHGV